jgi:hypothetical protein
MKSKITTVLLVSFFFFSAKVFAHRTPSVHKKNAKSEYKYSPILNNKTESDQRPKGISMLKYLSSRELKSSLQKYLKSYK